MKVVAVPTTAVEALAMAIVPVPIGTITWRGEVSALFVSRVKAPAAAEPSALRATFVTERLIADPASLFACAVWQPVHASVPVYVALPGGATASLIGPAEVEPPVGTKTALRVSAPTSVPRGLETGGSTRRKAGPGCTGSEKLPVVSVFAPAGCTTPLTIAFTVAPETTLSTPVVPSTATTVPVTVPIAVNVTAAVRVKPSTAAVTVFTSAVVDASVPVATPSAPVTPGWTRVLLAPVAASTTVLPATGAFETSRTTTAMVLVFTPSAWTEAGTAAIED